MTKKKNLKTGIWIESSNEGREGDTEAIKRESERGKVKRKKR